MNDNKRTIITDSKIDEKSEHPVGVGVGAVGAGAAAGAAGAVIGGPIGAVLGAAAGAVVGGLVGKVAAESINPTVETKYWRENHSSRPYGHDILGYEEYAPAYQYGWENFKRTGADNSTFETVEADMGRGWDRAKGTSKLAWNDAKDASRDAWNRVRDSVHGVGTKNER